MKAFCKLVVGLLRVISGAFVLASLCCGVHLLLFATTINVSTATCKLVGGDSCHQDGNAWAPDYNEASWVATGDQSDAGDCLVADDSSALPYFFKGFYSGLYHKAAFQANNEISCKWMAQMDHRKNTACYVEKSSLFGNVCGVGDGSAPLDTINSRQYQQTGLGGLGLFLVGAVFHSVANMVKRQHLGDSSDTLKTIVKPSDDTPKSPSSHTSTIYNEELEPLTGGQNPSKPTGIASIITACCRCGRNPPPVQSTKVPPSLPSHA